MLYYWLASDVTAEQGTGGHFKFKWALSISCRLVPLLNSIFEIAILAIIVIEFYGAWNSGMMGSGKTTVGRILSEALGYSFTDRLVISLCMYVFIGKNG